MIYIHKNSINNFVLTLSENSRLTTPNYLFEFKNEYNLNSSKIYWSNTDISNYPNRYNQFVLNENTSGSTTGGTSVSLSLISGQYSYKVYESTTPTLIVSQTTERIVEEGRMVVTGDNNETLINTSNSIYT